MKLPSESNLFAALDALAKSSLSLPLNRLDPLEVPRQFPADLGAIIFGRPADPTESRYADRPPPLASALAMSSSSTPPRACVSDRPRFCPIDGQSRAKCPFSPHLKHASAAAPLGSRSRFAWKCALSGATLSPMLSTSCATDPHRSPTTSASDLPSSAARSLARRRALSLHEAPPSPTPPLAPEVSSAAPGASLGRVASACSVGFPSPPSFQNGFSSRSAATLAALVASASRLCCEEDFGSRAFEASSARARSRPPPIQSSRPPSGLCRGGDRCESPGPAGGSIEEGPSLGSSSSSEPEELDGEPAAVRDFFSRLRAFLASFLARFFSFRRSRSTSSLATILTPPRRPILAVGSLGPRATRSALWSPKFSGSKKAEAKRHEHWHEQIGSQRRAESASAVFSSVVRRARSRARPERPREVDPGVLRTARIQPSAF